MQSREAYGKLLAWSRELTHLGTTMGLLHWDQRTHIPPKGHDNRAEQIATLARIHHQRETDPRAGEWLAAVEGTDLVTEPESAEAVNVREWRRSYDKAVKIPESLAVALAKAQAHGQSAWEKAKPQSDWAAFQPSLVELVGLRKEQAQVLGYEHEAYDALLDDYEPGAKAAEIEPVFRALRVATVKLLDRLRDLEQPKTVVVGKDYPLIDQERACMAVAARLGYDLDAGRLDTTMHPFSTCIGPGDARITTSYDPQDFTDALFSVVHEAGHAMYSQGQPKEHHGTPRGEYASLSVHESQSRMWENFVGRSPGFWAFFQPYFQMIFPALRDVSAHDAQRWVSRVQPGYIRVQADELTYNLHVMLRFDLELAVMRGKLVVADLPEAWDGKMQDYLGLKPPCHAKGVMQDVHWSGGLFGYFPTYTLGNIYAAQFFAAAQQELGDMGDMFARGEFAPLLGWLRREIHSRGKTLLARDLVQRVTGQEPDARYLVEHLTARCERAYYL
ncbi:carboxypeptidase M32 [Desulfocurvibacter africanus]|uniref:carboxypeptidase M32 n=1 Tax=Desulfocurvibacter africanus TaxID=873 RepID=UPI002FD8D834